LIGAHSRITVGGAGGIRPCMPGLHESTLPTSLTMLLLLNYASAPRVPIEQL